MKMIRVVAAVICDDIQTKHKIYATSLEPGISGIR